MAHRKGAGTAKNLRDSNPKYLGIKIADGQHAKAGSIIVRQRGTSFMAGKNVGMGKDHSLFAIRGGSVAFSNKRKTRYDNSTVTRKVVSIT